MDYLNKQYTLNKDFPADPWIDVEDQNCNQSQCSEMTYQHHHSFSDLMSFHSYHHQDQMLKIIREQSSEVETEQSVNFPQIIDQEFWIQPLTEDNKLSIPLETQKISFSSQDFQTSLSTVQMEILPEKNLNTNFDIDIFFTPSVEEISQKEQKPVLIKSKSKRIAKSGPKKPTKKATESIKKIMRQFRKYIKDHDSYDIKSVEEYFTLQRFNFSPEQFKEYQGIFEELTACKKGPKTTNGNQEMINYIETLHTVFNQSPSKTNLAKFFQNPIIQALWWGDAICNNGTSYSNSKYLNSVLMGIDSEILIKVYKFFKDVQTPNQENILPQY